MLRHLLERLFHSLLGRKHHGHHGGGRYGYGNHYSSSSDYKKGNYYPPHNSNYGHGHYKKKYKSFSS
ncbi:hypothetical protein [Paenibacillus silvisoli]|uniref:hypothetical protein n=1 Tax=Paenibacillus silvisoli TaxID=3110539 RepID=UPI0028039AA7|nr:hypothetical protein [Paenibacillus silvisoli]